MFESSEEVEDLRQFSQKFPFLHTGAYFYKVGSLGYSFKRFFRFTKNYDFLVWKHGMIQTKSSDLGVSK